MRTLKRSTFSKAPSPERLHLPVLSGVEPASPDEPRRRLPSWIKAKLPTGDAFFELRSLLAGPAHDFVTGPA